MTRRRLIIHADDFGFSAQVNAAVREAHRSGTLTSCSLMVAEEGASQALSLAKKHPGLSVGIHLVAVMGRSVLPHKEIPSITDRNGYFPRDPVSAGFKYFFSSKAKKELHKELGAQLERFLSAGVKPTHMDSHLHLHIHPVIFEMVLELGEKYGIHRLRVPRDSLRAAPSVHRDQPMNKMASALIFRYFTGRMEARARKKNFCHPKRVYGHFMTGKMSEEYVLAVLDQLPSGTSEIYFHPALHSLSRGSSPEQIQCRREFDILMSKAFKRKIEERKIHLIGYGGLEREI